MTLESLGGAVLRVFHGRRGWQSKVRSGDQTTHLLPLINILHCILPLFPPPPPSPYPSSPPLLSDIRLEALEALGRAMGHPSVVIVGGNNEASGNEGGFPTFCVLLLFRLGFVSRKYVRKNDYATLKL